MKNLEKRASKKLHFSEPARLSNRPVKVEDMLIGALLRVPAEAIFRRIVRELNQAGFNGITVAHLPVLRFPGPDGVRPGILAERAGMSKQAMNRLLGSLEDLGYLVRRGLPAEGRARVVRFTRPGHAVYAKEVEILRGIERDWIAVLGEKDFQRLKRLLGRVWQSTLVR
jgi:DNA-binding MarR family transcriptional regulator